MTIFCGQSSTAVQSISTKKAPRVEVEVYAGLCRDYVKAMDNSISGRFARRKGFARYCRASLIFGGAS